MNCYPQMIDIFTNIIFVKNILALGYPYMTIYAESSTLVHERPNES